MEKFRIALDRLLVEIQMLITLLAKIQKEVSWERKYGWENIYCHVEYLNQNLRLGSNMDVKVTNDERTQKEMRKMLLETGGKGILAT